MDKLLYVIGALTALLGALVVPTTIKADRAMDSRTRF
jgi:hypothetical protein